MEDQGAGKALATPNTITHLKPADDEVPDPDEDDLDDLDGKIAEVPNHWLLF